MKITLIFAFLFLAGTSCCFANGADNGICRTSGSGAASQNETQKKVPIDKLTFTKEASTDLLVVIFLGTDCPISQKYMHTLRELNKDFGSDVTFFGLIPKNFEIAQIAKFKKEFDVPFELIQDRDNAYAQMLNATITPEVFLFDTSGNLYYDGAIDNWFFALGRNRMKPTEFYVQDAISNVLKGLPVTVSHAKAVGCLIEMKH